MWNYRLFFDPNTFRLRDVSTAEWNKDPYLINRLTDRDLWLNVDWTTIVMWFLPPAWVIICAAQVYNTHLQFKIGRYVVRQCDADGAKAKDAEKAPPLGPVLLQTQAKQAKTPSTDVAKVAATSPEAKVSTNV